MQSYPDPIDLVIFQSVLTEKCPTLGATLYILFWILLYVLKTIIGCIIPIVEAKVM